MNNTFRAVLSLVILLYTLHTYAAEDRFYLIADAGSTGTTLHLFKYSSDKMPVIVDMFSKKTTIPLASFSEEPEKAYESLKPLLKTALEKMNHQHIKTPIPISILGTAGMRLLTSDKQQAIYQNLLKNISTDYKTVFTPKNIQTLSGKMEGVYGWLDVNYLLENFQHDLPTAGSIDIGGVSVEIAYATEKSKKPIDETILTINEKKYIVFSKSFLGLGLNEVQNSLKADPHAGDCYPAHYKEASLTGKFNLPSCSALYHEVLDNYHISELGLTTYNIPMFVVYSGAYHVFHFFGADPSILSQDALEQTIIIPTCSNSWETLKEAYPTETEKHLANYCGYSIFLSNLFYDAFQLQQRQIKILSSIKENKIYWPLGAMLYIITTGEA